MSYTELSVKRRPPKLHKLEIDGMWVTESNSGRYYQLTLDGPEHIDDMRDRLYKENEIDNG